MLASFGKHRLKHHFLEEARKAKYYRKYLTEDVVNLKGILKDWNWGVD
jgi:hypothetical protein